MVLTFCTTPLFLGRMKWKGSFIRGPRRSLVYWPCWFFRCLYFYLSGWDLGGRPDGKCGLSIGWFDWPADLRCRSKLATMLAFMLGIFLMTVLRRLIDNSVWRLSTLVPFILTTWWRILPVSVKMSSSCLFGLSLGIVSILLWRSDGYAYNHSFMTEISRKPWWLMGILLEKRRRNSFGKPSLWPAWSGVSSLGPFFDLFDPVLWTETIWLVSIILTIFLIYRAIQYFEVFHFNRHYMNRQNNFKNKLNDFVKK